MSTPSAGETERKEQRINALIDIAKKTGQTANETRQFIDSLEFKDFFCVIPIKEIAYARRFSLPVYTYFRAAAGGNKDREGGAG